MGNNSRVIRAKPFVKTPHREHREGSGVLPAGLKFILG
jgi:hypothetical protein